MKITRLAIRDDGYNALEQFDQSFTYIPSKKKLIEPICLVGTNGAGKSNLLELIAEVFYQVEIDIRKIQTSDKPSYKLSKHVILEYILFDENGGETKVRIDSYNDSKEWRLSTFELVEGDIEKVAEHNISNGLIYDLTEYENDDIHRIKKKLPSKIIAYSSGQNESLSYWFSELNKLYSKEVREAAFISDKKVEDTRMVYMDYDCNSSILLANYIFKEPSEFDIFDTYIRLKDVAKFRITLNFKLSAKNYILLSNEHRELISKFRSCTPMFKIEQGEVINPKTKEIVKQEISAIFDFHVNEQTRKAFRDNFDSTFDIFMAFQKFELLNQLKLSTNYTRASKSKDMHQRAPIVGHEDRVFRFDDIFLNINQLEYTIPYIGISDGEHQFLQTVGTILLFEQRNVLFLLDEPETHFNPQWRRSLVSILNQKTENRFQEIIITTHSPFIISDCKDYNVFIFKRIDGKVVFNKIDIRTYGTSVETILLRAFGMEESISQMATDEIKDILAENDYYKAKEKLEKLGSSYEKMEAVKHVQSLKKE